VSPFDAYPDASHEITHSNAGSVDGSALASRAAADDAASRGTSAPAVPDAGSPQTPTGALAVV